MYNLVGSIAPMFVTVLTVPAYLHLVGNTRYGVLALVWSFLGYFGMFDPGISRAAAYHIARLNDGSAKAREDVFWTAMVINLGFGLFGGLLLFLVAEPLFVSTFKMPQAMRAEVIASLPWLAASLPISIVGNVLDGVLQAREWFGVSNAVNVVNALASQLVALAVAFFHGPELTWLIPAILLTRVAGTVPIFLAVGRALPLGAGGGFRRALVRILFSYGGWITITNLLNPLFASLDRLLIGSILNADAVSFYAVANNLVSKISVVPNALSTSLFPKLSRGSSENSGRLASDAAIDLAAVMTPLTVTGIIALPIFMRIWVGADFAAHATPVAIILLLGLWINGLASIPYCHLQAQNRPDLVAKFHALEVLPFLALLWFGLHYYGLIGAAWVATFRVTFDAILLFAVAGRLDGWPRIVPAVALVVIAPFVAPSSISSPIIVLASLLLTASLIWSWYVAPSLRNIVVGRFLSLYKLKTT